jgi:hypothetical protein
MTMRMYKVPLTDLTRLIRTYRLQMLEWFGPDWKLQSERGEINTTIRLRLYPTCYATCTGDSSYDSYSTHAEVDVATDADVASLARSWRAEAEEAYAEEYQEDVDTSDPTKVG